MPLPPMDFLLEASLRSLNDLELSARNRAANLSKTLREEIDAWVEQEATAMLAKWMQENRGALVPARAAPKKVDFLESKEMRKTA